MLTIGRARSWWELAVRMKSQTLIGYSTFASSRTSDPVIGLSRFIG